MGRFQDLTILVTGATGAFGRSAAQRFASEGARLVLSDLVAEPLKDLADTLETETATLTGDIADERLSDALVKLALARFGKLDIAVNNAGVAQSLLELPLIPSHEARRVIEIELLSVFYAMKYQIPVMEEQHRASGRRGAIVNIASFAGLAGAARLSVYSAAKHGVVGLTRSAAAEYASKSIRINAVCPSYATTKMVEDFVKLDGRMEMAAEPTRRADETLCRSVDEVAEVILFAADPKNLFMTGSTIRVDGGIIAVCADRNES